MRADEMIPLMTSDSPSAIAWWSDICHAADRREDEWIRTLRADGVKAAHPDDGWVDRKEDSINFAYARFNDGVKPGDRIALGDPHKWRIVTVTKIVDCGIIMPMRRYFFESIPETHL